jgi:hypothetical protein
MWKLFATLLVVSDTGSVSMTVTTAEFTTQNACIAVGRELFTVDGESVLNGHKVVIKPRFACRPDSGAEGMPPPPVGFLNGIQRGY